MKKNALLFIAILFLSGTLFAQAPTPFAFFPFNTDFNDVMKNVTAKLIGTVLPTITDDPVRGRVVSFPGGDDTVGSAIFLSFNSYAFNEATYTLWIKVNALDPYARFFDFGTESSWGTKDNFWATPANGRFAQRMSVTIDAGTDFAGVEVPYGDDVINVNQWYMFTAALNKTNLKLWVDGVPVADSLHDSNSTAAERDISEAYLGKSTYPTDPILNGYLDNFKIFDKFLTDEQVKDIYDAEKDVSDPVQKVKSTTVFVYPNPVIDYLNIIADFDKVIIDNILGQEISSINQIKTNKLCVGYLSKGVYILRVYKGERYIGAVKIMKN
jgi:hypothetical protein